MTVSDDEIRKAARRWLKQHGDAARERAQEMIQELLRKGETATADTWLRIIAEIDRLRTPDSRT